MNKEKMQDIKERLDLFPSNMNEPAQKAYCELFDYINNLEKQSQKYKKVIDKAIEYITSYESISTIQGLENADINKQFDEKTMTEMINRYLLVHDKLLQILEDKEVE